MKLRGFLYLSVFIFSVNSVAETHYLLIDPGASPRSNFYRYYNQVRKAYEVLKSSQKDVQILAKDGSWKLTQQDKESISDFALTQSGASNQKAPSQNDRPVYPKVEGPARDLNDIGNAIKSMKLKPGDSLVINFVAHGNSPSDPNDSATATLVGWKSEFQFKELGKELETIPDQVKVKIITQTCYGGGVHSISRNNKNVCSASTTNYQNTESAGNFQEAIFTDAIWDHFQKQKGQVSFADLNLTGFRNDIANNNLGRLSSFDFVDYVLKKGPYEKSRPDGSGKWVDLNGQRIWQKTTPDGYSTALPPDAQIFSTYLPNSLDDNFCAVCSSNSVQSDLARLERLTRSLKDIARQATITDLHQKVDKQPKEIRTIFNAVIDDMNKNGTRYAELVKQYNQKYKDLVQRWNEHKVKYKDSWGITKWWYGEGDTRAKMQKEFDELKSKSEQDLKQYSFDHQMLERLDKLDEFNRKATPGQKKKFVQLLQCEWEPL